MKSKILLVALSIFLIGGSSACVADVAPPIDVNANGLYYTYLNNEIKADSLFRGQLVKVDGEVGLIARRQNGKAYLIFRDKGGVWFLDMQMGGVLCEFSKKNEVQLIDVREGNRVYVKGKCKGLEGDYVIVEDCIVELHPYQY